MNTFFPIHRTHICLGQRDGLWRAVWGARTHGTSHISGACMQRPDQDESSFFTSLRQQTQPASAAIHLQLPLRLCGFRYHLLPFQDPATLRKTIPYQLSPRLIRPEKEYLHTFFPIQSSERANILSVSVLRDSLSACAAPVENYLQQKIITFPIALFSLAACCAQHDDALFLLVEVHGTSCSLLVMEHATPLFVREFCWEHNNSASPAPLLDQSLAFFHAATGRREIPDRIYFSGTASTFERFSDLMQKEMPRAHVAPVHDALAGHSFSSALSGTASVKENNGLLSLAADCFHVTSPQKRNAILPNIVQEKRSFPALLPALRRTAIVLTALSMVVIGTLSLDLTLLSRQKTALEHNIRQVFTTALPTQQTMADPVRQMEAYAKARGNRDDRNVFPFQPFRALEILRELSQRIPMNTGIMVREVSIGEKAVTLAGSAPSLPEVNMLRERLAASPLFGEVTVQLAKRQEKEQESLFALSIQPAP